MQPIFSDNFLANHLSSFSLSSVPGIRNTTTTISAFLQEVESGKIRSLKEEEIKTRFINIFFGDALGFNYGNSNEWLLREEKKSTVDGTKPDAVLGYFFIDKAKDDVRALIELKSSGTDLNAAQKRTGQQSPVEQAFGYAPKMGGNCKWVIVSNIDEIRFYPAADVARYQQFFLKDLLQEQKLKEFLYLFHKDRFIKKEGKSATDILFERSKLAEIAPVQNIHILDRIYYSLKRFEGFGFVDPNYIANLRPFNILEDHVWHYEDQNLFTINPEIYQLFVNITVTDSKIEITPALEKELNDVKVFEAPQKLQWIFSFLNHSLISSISTIKDHKAVDDRNKRTIGHSSRFHFNFKEGEEGITKNIFVLDNYTCNCISCQYRTFDFNSMLKKLHEVSGTDDSISLECAFGNYLVSSDNYKTTYTILKKFAQNSKGVEGKEVQYFLARQNTQYLYNLISDYHLPDREQMMEESKTVDLDKVIYDEIEFSVDEEVKRYLVKVKEDDLIYKMQDKIEETCDKIWELDKLYKNGDRQFSGPDLPRILIRSYLFLYFHVNTNYIIYDIFRRYRSLTLKVFRSLVLSHSIPDYGFEKFDSFLLTEAIIHIDPSHMKKVLKDVKELKVSSTTSEKMILKLDNLLKSYFRDSFFGKPQKNDILQTQLSNHRFESNYTNIFFNIFSILTVIEVDKERFAETKKLLLKFLAIEEHLSWSDLKELGYFIDRKGDLFESSEMESILEIAINRETEGSHKYKDLTELVCYAMRFYHPDHRIENAKLIQKAILNCSTPDGRHPDCTELVAFIDITGEENRKALETVFEKQLDRKFRDDLYQSLLWNGTLDFNKKDYLKQYCEYINLHKGGSRAIKYGQLELTDLVFINFISTVYKTNISFDRSELKLFTDLNPFERWLLDPENFDYAEFDAGWLIDVKPKYMLDRLKNITAIRAALTAKLQDQFDPVLAELQHAYFSEM